MSSDHYMGTNHEGDYVYIGHSSSECTQLLRNTVTPSQPGFMATFKGSSRVPVEVQKASLDARGGFSLAPAPIGSVAVL